MSIECDKPSSKVLESKELPQKIFKTITNDDVGVENSKPNKYTLSVDVNNIRKFPIISKLHLQLTNRNPMNVLCH